MKGKKIGIICVLCLITVIFSVKPAYAKENIDLSPQSDIYNSIDQYLQKCVKNANIPALSVSIVDKDKTLFSGNYGECKSSETPFFLGSVSKSFTAVCIMRLAEQQKLDLNAAVSTYLSEATDGDKITVSQLLNHTSGLGEHQTLKNYKIINEQGIHTYANVNYSLLGEIIEAVSGKSYSRYISENLFEPLGLSHTAADLDKSVENGLINGYTNYWGIPIKRTHKYPSSKNAWITPPAGYISASSEDLGRYLQMYLRGGEGIISQESIDRMFYGDTVYVAGDIPFWYGYGWSEIKEPLSQPVFRHSGLIETGTSGVFIIPEMGIGVALEANVNDYFVTNEMMDSLGWGVVLMLLGENPNEISENAYMLSHLRINLIMLAVLLTAILPWLFLSKYIRNINRGNISVRIVRILLLHILLTIFIMLLVPIFFSTPLWVARDFVPDVFITVIISSALLFTSGLIKIFMLYRQKDLTKNK